MCTKVFSVVSDEVRKKRPAHVSLDAQLRADVLNILRDAREWQLTTARWGVVADAVRVLTAALSSGDVAALRDAVSDLELTSPVRATCVGDTPTVPTPERVLEEINELIHTVDSQPHTAE